MGDQQQERPASERGRIRNRKSVLRWVWRTVYLLLAIGAAVLVVLAYRPKPLAVDVGQVVRGDLEVTLREEGKTRVKERYVISAPVAAKLMRSELHAGDEVSAGQTVARLLPVSAPLLDERSEAQAQARVAAARAGKAQAEALVERLSAEVSFAERDVARKRGLSQQRAISQSALDATELKLASLVKQMRSAEFGVQVAAHELQVAQATLRRGVAGAEDAQSAWELTAPTAGRVLQVHQESQATVVAGAPLLSIGDCSALEVVVDVLTADAVALEEGSVARLTRWGGDEVLSAHVVRVEPSAFTRISSLGIEEQRVRVVLELDSPYEQWRSLGDGFRVEVELSLERLQAVVRVPLGAVFRSGSQWAVYRMEGGKAHLNPITIGQRTDLWVEVQSGLEPAQSVVLYPGERVGDGQLVTPRT